MFYSNNILRIFMKDNCGHFVVNFNAVKRRYFSSESMRIVHMHLTTKRFNQLKSASKQSLTIKFTFSKKINKSKLCIFMYER